MDPLEYYVEQSRITDPGDYAWLFVDLPCDVAGLCQVVQGLVLHYVDCKTVFGYDVPAERLVEVDTCYVRDMLDRIYQLDQRPLIEPRPLEKRLVGCCRDFAVLFCAMARHKGIPTRTRVGFAAYFEPGWYTDHEIAEYWNAHEKRWHLVDPEITDLDAEYYKISFDVQDVPRNQFLVGGQAWQMCRTGATAADAFCQSPDSSLRGWWFIRHKLVQDLAALNKKEILLWHSWGLMEQEPDEESLALLDSVAELTQRSNRIHSNLSHVFAIKGLAVPQIVRSHSPVALPSDVSIDS